MQRVQPRLPLLCHISISHVKHLHLRAVRFLLKGGKATVVKFAGCLTEIAQQFLGHSVVIKRFMVTSCGRTGYLHPYQEQLPITGEYTCSTADFLLPNYFANVFAACRLLTGCYPHQCCDRPWHPSACTRGLDSVQDVWFTFEAIKQSQQHDISW